MSAQNPVLNRTWKEVQKKYYNLLLEAKKQHTKQKNQMMVTGGGVVDPDVAARSYNDLPFYSRFILEHILPAVIIDGVPGGFESGTQAATLPEEEEQDEGEVNEATQYGSRNGNEHCASL